MAQLPSSRRETKSMFAPAGCSDGSRRSSLPREMTSTGRTSEQRTTRCGTPGRQKPMRSSPAARAITTSGRTSLTCGRSTPEVDLPQVSEVRPDVVIARAAGEERMGFCRPGVPHLVVRCSDVLPVDVISRGRELRRDPSLQPAGANIDFVSRREDGSWAIRTYERGVEGETLACGTGAI